MLSKHRGRSHIRGAFCHVLPAASSSPPALGLKSEVPMVDGGNDGAIVLSLAPALEFSAHPARAVVVSHTPACSILALVDPI